MGEDEKKQTGKSKSERGRRQGLWDKHSALQTPVAEKILRRLCLLWLLSNARCGVRRATDSRVSRESPFKRRYVTSQLRRAPDNASAHSP